MSEPASIDAHRGDALDALRGLFEHCRMADAAGRKAIGNLLDLADAEL